MPRRSPLIPMLLIGAIVCARDIYVASTARQPKMPTEQQFLQGQIHTLRPQRATKELPVSIEGRTLVHDARTDTYTISGAARVEQRPTTITADQIVLQHRYRGVATGHVHIIDPER
jgi:lipopolysaccharide assembly outer membrane protein LptD (OstA)